MQIQRALDAVDAAVSLRAPETALRFATVYVASVATRLGDEDIRAMRTLRDCLGSAWRQNAIMLWTHADLLERNTLQDHLEGLDEEIRRATIDSLGGGSLVVDNARGGDAGDQTHRDLLIAAVRRLAGPRPHPRGKHARRLRQHATRQRERDNDPADGGRWCAVM
ncbi:hypothetical protein M885DRAFT_508487 [Pelagophyceae sp. CCMP2097]|nr:hypothetical protein M885DRAFT_508487 [Pelagophyceae sp. CCMP2097]